MTDKELQNIRMHDFNFRVIPAIATGATIHFLDALEKEVTIKKSQLHEAGVTEDDAAKELLAFETERTKYAHWKICQHTLMISGGFTAAMFPDLVPQEPGKEVPVEVMPDPSNN